VGWQICFPLRSLGLMIDRCVDRRQRFVRLLDGLWRMLEEASRVKNSTIQDLQKLMQKSL
jgi:hypothetical protein